MSEVATAQEPGQLANPALIAGALCYYRGSTSPLT